MIWEPKRTGLKTRRYKAKQDRNLLVALRNVFLSLRYMQFHLPPKFEVLTHFGERADISPDNQCVAFMAKSFGDAMVIDLKTREIRGLTCNIPAAVFLRVMHLVTGDCTMVKPRSRASTCAPAYQGGKASNAVISTDGLFMALQVAKTDDPAGVGYGILLFHFKP